MNSGYIGYHLSAKGTAFIPSPLAFTMFGMLVNYFSKGGPPNKVAPTDEMNDVIESAADVKDGAEDSSSSPHITMSRQSMSSYKSEYMLPTKPESMVRFLVWIAHTTTLKVHKII